MSHHEHHHELTLDEMRAALTAEVWDERYGASERVWSGRPNLRLTEQTADLAPGTALDVGCGEGGDAIWLAEQGWHVTAADVSEVALEKVRAHAVERGVEDAVTTLAYDVLAGDALPGGFDLVTTHFMHVPVEDFAGVYNRIAAAVAPGGRLLVVAHHPHDVESGARAHHGPGLLFGPDRVLDLFSEGWEVEVADVLDRVQETTEGSMEVRDTVVRLRRSGNVQG